MLTPPEYRLKDVVITCPATELPIPTGVQLSAAVYATAVFTNVRVYCPHCEGEHRWSKADAFLAEIEPGAAAPVRAFGRRPTH